MKAVVFKRYGRPDVLRVEDVPTPSPAAGQVLVKVAATSINLSDWEGLRGSPFYARLGVLPRTHRPRLAGRPQQVPDSGDAALAQLVGKLRAGELSPARQCLHDGGDGRSPRPWVLRSRRR